MKHQVDPSELVAVEPEALAEISGGMRWEQFRRSTNVEDRRPHWAIERDNRWWERQHAVPLPPRRPPGL